MKHYQFNVKFTRPDENDVTEYEIGYNVYGKYVNTLEQAEESLRNAFNHLTIVSITLFRFSEE